MRLMETIVKTVVVMLVGGFFGFLAAGVYAQAPQQQSTQMTPEQQIEALQQQTIDLRKQNGQLISQMAFCEEYALKTKKELKAAQDHAAAQDKAAQAAKAPVPDVGKK